MEKLFAMCVGVKMLGRQMKTKKKKNSDEDFNWDLVNLKRGKIIVFNFN